MKTDVLSLVFPEAVIRRFEWHTDFPGAVRGPGGIRVVYRPPMASPLREELNNLVMRLETMDGTR